MIHALENDTFEDFSWENLSLSFFYDFLISKSLEDHLHGQIAVFAYVTWTPSRKFDIDTRPSIRLGYF